METIIGPIIKNTNGLITDNNNYRPIAITSVVYKILELWLYTLKQITEYYNQRSSPVYICYLDLSKAFDRTNHWCLFKKLTKRNIDVTLISYSGIVNKHFVYIGVTNYLNSLLCLMIKTGWNYVTCVV